MPVREVLHRWVAKVLHEAFVQRRARQTDFAGEFVHHPITFRVRVHALQCLADKMIPQSREPARGIFRQAVEIEEKGEEEKGDATQCQ